MLPFEMKTVIVSYIFSNVICAAVVTTLWLENRKRAAGLGLWLVDFVLQVLSLLLVAMRGQIPELVSTTVSNALIIGGTILLFMGLERFVGKQGPHLQNAILFAVFVAAHAYYVAVIPNLSMRTLLFSLGLLVICAQCAWLLLYRVDENMRRYTRNLGNLFIVYCLVSVARIVSLWFHKLPSQDFFQADSFEVITVMMYQMLFIALTLYLFLTVNRRLVIDLENDIQKRQQIEDALRLSDEKFFKAFHASPDAVIITRSEDGQLVDVNEGFTRLSGYSREESIGHTTTSLGLWGDTNDRENMVETVYKADRVRDFEVKLRNRIGGVWIGLISTEKITIGGTTHLLSIIRDVTERKRAEEALRENEALYHEMFSGHSAVKLLVDPLTGNIVDANPAASDYYGYSIEQLRSMKVTQINNLTHEQFKKAVQEVLNHKRKPFHVRHRLASGEVREVESYSAPIQVKGRQLLHSIIHDVTERKQLEESLHHRNDLLATLHQVTLDLIDRREMEDLMKTLLARIGDLLNAQDVSVDLLESENVLVTYAVSSNQPLLAGDVMRRGEGGFLSWQAIETGQPAVVEDYATWPRRRQQFDGFPIHAIMVVPIKHKERVIGTINFSRRASNDPFNETDTQFAEQLAQAIALVTHNAQVYSQLQSELKERQLVEEALRASEERYQAFITQSFEAIYRTEFDKPIDISLPVETQIDQIYDHAYMAECNQAMADLYNISSPEDMLGMRLLDAHGRRDNEVNRAVFRKFIKNDYRATNDETVEIDTQGQTIWFLSNTIGIVENGYLVRMWGTSIDITERKLAEEALRSSEERFRQLVTSAPDVVFGVNEHGQVVFANMEASKLLGYSYQDFMGMNIEAILPPLSPDGQPVSRDGGLDRPPLHPVVGTERIAIRQDGHEIPVDVKLSHMKTDTGLLLIAFMRDMTERKLADEQLQQAHDQLLEQQRKLAKIEERQLVARDLHDSVNQSIHSLVLFSETLLSTLEKENFERARQIAGRLQESARQALKEMRLMLYQLQPSEMTRSIDLMRDLEVRLTTVERRSGIKASIIVEGSIEDCPVTWNENLFWITIEALNNSIKHAQAHEVKITLRCFPELVELEVVDDGVGFDVERLRSGGMGLFTMRDRAEMLEGNLIISSKPGNGTSVCFHREFKERP